MIATSVRTDWVSQLQQQHNITVRTVAINRVCDLKAELEERCRRGELDEEFRQERLAFFEFHPPDGALQAQSLIVTAVPRPQARAIFHWRGELRPLILPPTYVAYDRTTRQIESLLAGILSPMGYHVAPSLLPLKLLAAHSGLAAYGRNNICYIRGMGSFLQLVAVYSDMPCDQDQWQEAQMLERCRNCVACLRHCPTNAITRDRFLLHAERCIPFHNERPGRVPFPTWLNPAWHNCLQGCLFCQRICPENKPFLEWIGEQAEFDEAETDLLLQGTAVDRLYATTREKLEYLDLLDSLDILPRNLAVLFDLNEC